MSAGQIAAALAAVALVAFAVRGRRHVGLLLVAAAALGVYAAGLLELLPNPESVIEDLATTLGEWTYVLVGGLAYLETGAFVGLVAPGETAVIVGGVIAGQGEIDLGVLIGIVWTAAVLGDTTSFFIGRRLGREFLLRHGPRLRITHERLGQVEQYFRRHGGKTILIGRFIGIVRAVAPFIAGSSRMAYGRFLPYSVLGTGMWSATFCVLGYAFWRSFSKVADIAGRATFAFGVVVAATVGLVWAYRRLRHAEERQRVAAWLEQRPVLAPLSRRVLRPAWRVARPRLRFMRDRLTPGGLGIELTTVIAAAVAGLYAFGVYAVLLLGEHGILLPGDRVALDLTEDLHSAAAVDVLEVLTDLGALPVVGTLVLVAAVLLLWRRRPADAFVLVVGLALLVVAVQATKAGLDRERPVGPLSSADGAAYPSGHAAYATVYIALAVAARRALPSLAIRAVGVAAMAALAAFVGLTRVYLRSHYWSDVVGGWGLGIGVFAVCAGIALVVTHLRHNEGALTARSDHG